MFKYVNIKPPAVILPYCSIMELLVLVEQQIGSITIAMVWYNPIDMLIIFDIMKGLPQLED